MRVIVDLFRTLSNIVPAPVLAGLVAVFVVTVAPGWFESLRIRQIRGAVRQMIRADDAERARLTATCFELAANKPERLKFLYEESVRRTQVELRDKAAAALTAAGTAIPKPVEKAANPGVPPPPVDTHPLMAAVAVQRMLDEQLYVRARERLATALKRWPDDAELLALSARLDAASPAESGDTAQGAR